MRYVLIACVLAVALAFGLAVPMVPSDDSLESVNAHDPATLSPATADRVHTFKATIRTLLDTRESAGGEPSRHGSQMVPLPQLP